ncbi:hypothetical protein FB45DRAFT_1062767 [Roridomyces roridus]|uniref:Uncharacterized protein n=1 Tax=Roridomyces roridus TaxID=1738132 RepID=A0AAD7BF23_9AGAR|nr:hypothetical protein FB45DRAFT_1062767 [Roridomyces roridus]
MFGEDLSESRVPSPWDTIISTPPSPSPSPLAAIPKLVPEQDDGNVEYKLQLLSPSPARFARLVTQMKWRLLEGSGQAYYEIGVADSGLLIGLPRAELEQSLETLEMMAGEIGASVIVVKEIEVPAALAGLAGTQTDSWNGKRGLRRQLMSSESSADDSTATNTETEMSATDVEEDLSSTVLLSDKPQDPSAIFFMDDVDSAAENGDVESSDESPPIQPVYTIDLEIASVFKPRPMRAKAASHVPLPTKNKRGSKTRKGKHLPDGLITSTSPVDEDAVAKPPARDRKREARREALVTHATAALAEPDIAAAVDDAGLVSDLEALHVAVEPFPLAIVSEQTIPSLELTAAPDAEVAETVDVDEEDDVFPSPMTAVPGPFPEFASQLTVPIEISVIRGAKNEDGTSALPRLIVEALVVRKMSIEEAFLDFGGFSLT